MDPRARRVSLVVVGRVLKPHGVLGWMRVEVLSENPRRFTPGNSFILEGREGSERLLLEEAEKDREGLKVRFRGVDTRQEAGALCGRRLFITPDETGEPPPSAMWEHQLLGLEVRTREGRVLGEVVEVMETGANDVLVVRGEREFLIPAIAPVVREVDEASGTMVIEPLPGLLEL